MTPAAADPTEPGEPDEYTALAGKRIEDWKIARQNRIAKERENAVAACGRRPPESSIAAAQDFRDRPDETAETPNIGIRPRPLPARTAARRESRSTLKTALASCAAASAARTPG